MQEWLFGKIAAFVQQRWFQVQHMCDVVAPGRLCIHLVTLER